MEEGVPTSTYLDHLGPWWSSSSSSSSSSVNAQSGSCAETAAKAMEENRVVGAVDELFLACQAALGLPPWAVLLLWGGLIRMLTLCTSLYADRATAVMQQCALPELRAPQQTFSRVYYSNTASARQIQLAAIVFKSERRRVYRKYHTSLFRCMASLAGTPLALAGLMQVSTLCGNPFLSVGTSSFLWCAALTLPDPLCVLPVVCCALTLLNLELSLPRRSRRGWVLNLVWVTRVACLCIVPVAASFRSGVCLYLVGMNMAGLLQPLLLRSHAFRRRFGFPPSVSSTDTAVVPSRSASPKPAMPVNATDRDEEAMDSLQLCLTAQLPYLSHMLHPVSDNESSQGTLLRRSEPVRAPPSPRLPRNKSVVGDYTRRHYAAGSNPLMREQPLSSRTRAPSIRLRADETKEKMIHRRAEEKQGVRGDGWKAARSQFNESDFIVTDDETGTHKSVGNTTSTQSD